ncbi:MAG: peptidyl-prolyl cis-trans isomerase [Candidatus Woesearchaeota archaeon]
MLLKKNYNIMILSVIFVIFLLALVYFTMSLKHDVLASVNGEAITSRDVQVHLAFYPPSAMKTISKPQVMEELVRRKLLLQQARKENIQVSTKETNKFIIQKLQELDVPYSYFLNQLNESGITHDEAIKTYTEQLTLQKFIEQKDFLNVNVTDDEVREYYNKNKNLFMTPKLVRFSMITVQDKTLAKEIRDRAKKGENFASLVKQYGTEKEKQSSGDYGYMTYEQIPMGLNQLIFNLDVGKIDPGLPSTPLGYHIVKVTDIINPEQRTFEDVKGMIKKALILNKQKENLDIYVTQLKQSSIVEIHDKEYEQKATTEHLKCLKENNIDENSVVFYFSDNCSYCEKMEEIVFNLEDKGFNFVKVRHQGPKLDDLQACFSDIVTGKVPQFICASTKATIFGEQTEQQLKDFALECYLG